MIQDRKIFSKENIKINILITVFLSIVVPIVLGQLLNTYFKITFISIPIHSAIETLGGAIAIIISMIFYMKYRSLSVVTHFNWVTTALLAMGIIDIFHASVMPGELFVWLHSIAVFFGGIFFISVWFKERQVSKRTYNTIPVIFILFPIVVSLLSITYVENIPQMINPDKTFTTTANILNIIGGIGFFIASIKFLLEYIENKNLDELLFAGHAMLFGIAGILFVTSVVWDMQWWLWHILRLTAYSIAFYFLYKDYQKEIQAVEVMNDRLKIITNELNEYKNELEYKIKVEVAKNKKKDVQLFQQSRLAQMGEMISMIAHQWRQPLASISSISGTLSLDVMMDNYKKDFFQERLESIDEISQHLSSTINDFRDFYKPNKKKVTVILEDVVEKSLNIISGSLLNDNIEIIKEYNSKEKVELHDSELIQVVMNILKNAQDNFKEKQSKDPYIKITIENTTLSISDNGGGIQSNIIEKVFDPYFTTKDEKTGTGLGLYMSKTIIEEHHHGKLTVENTNDGVCFTITFRATL